MRNLLKLNLAARYIEIKQYDKSISLLEDLAGKRLLGSTAKMVCRLNLCMSYFYAAQYEKAMSLYNESQKIFIKIFLLAYGLLYQLPFLSALS